MSCSIPAHIMTRGLVLTLAIVCHHRPGAPLDCRSALSHKCVHVVGTSHACRCLQRSCSTERTIFWQASHIGGFAERSLRVALQRSRVGQCCNNHKHQKSNGFVMALKRMMYMRLLQIIKSRQGTCCSVCVSHSHACAFQLGTFLVKLQKPMQQRTLAWPPKECCSYAFWFARCANQKVAVVLVQTLLGMHIECIQLAQFWNNHRTEYSSGSCHGPKIHSLQISNRKHYALARNSV
jgi:hypothetical protein